MKKLAASLLIAGISFLGIGTQTAHAAGDDAVVSVEVLLNGDIEVTSTKDLSNVHIAVCVDGEVRVVKFDSLNDKVEVFDVDGDLIAVIAHSGNNTTAEAEALLTLLGGKVSGNSTGVVVLFDEEALEDCVPVTTTTTEPPTTTTTAPPTTTTTAPEVTTTTTPAPPVTVAPPAPAPKTVAPPAAPAPGELAHTGSGWGILAIIGAGLGGAGLLLLLLGELAKRRA